MMFSEWISTDERWKSEETFPQRISLKYLYAGPVKRMGNCPATFDALDISQILEKLPSASLPPQRESKSFPSDIESRQKTSLHFWYSSLWRVLGRDTSAIGVISADSFCKS